MARLIVLAMVMLLGCDSPCPRAVDCLHTRALCSMEGHPDSLKDACGFAVGRCDECGLDSSVDTP